MEYYFYLSPIVPFFAIIFYYCYNDENKDLKFLIMIISLVYAIIEIILAILWNRKNKNDYKKKVENEKNIETNKYTKKLSIECKNLLNELKIINKNLEIINITIKQKLDNM